MITLPEPLSEEHELGLGLPPALVIYTASLTDAPRSGADWPEQTDWVTCTATLHLPGASPDKDTDATAIATPLISGHVCFGSELHPNWGSYGLRRNDGGRMTRKRNRAYCLALWSDTLAAAQADVAAEIEKLRELVIRPREARLAQREDTLRAALGAPRVTKQRKSRQVRVAAPSIETENA